MSGHERIPLQVFLAELPEIEAAEARVAAAKIDALARTGQAMVGVERRFLPWALLGAGSFVLGIWLFLSGLGWPALACFSVLPVVATLYWRHVQPRTEADREADRLNRSHFLPHGGLYFAEGEMPGCVVRVSWSPPEPEPPLSQAPRDPRKRDVLPGRIW